MADPLGLLSGGGAPGSLTTGGASSSTGGVAPKEVLLTDDVFLRSPYAPLSRVYYEPGAQANQSEDATESSSPDESDSRSSKIDAAKMLDYVEFFGCEPPGTTMARCRRSVKKLEWLVCLEIVPREFFSTTGDHTDTTTSTSSAAKKNVWLEKLRALRKEYQEIKDHYKIDLAATVKRAQKNPKKFNPLSKAEDNPWDQVSEDEELMQEIAKDVERTYSDRELFTRKDVRGILQQVLYNWCKQFNPAKKAAESYRQGMNELCAIAYQVTHDGLCSTNSQLPFLKEFGDFGHREADCFILFRALMKHGFTPLFQVQAPVYTTVEENGESKIADLTAVGGIGGVNGSSLLGGGVKHSPRPVVEVQNPQTAILDQCNHIMDVLLKKVEPELHRLLVDTYAIPAQVFLLRWIRLMFCREFSVEATLDVWADIFQDALLNGESDRFTLASYFAVAMLRYMKAELMASDESTCIKALMAYPQVDVDPLLKMAKHVRHEVEPNKRFSIGLEIKPPSSGELVPLPGTTVVMPASSPPLQQSMMNSSPLPNAVVPPLFAAGGGGSTPSKGSNPLGVTGTGTTPPINPLHPLQAARPAELPKNGPLFPSATAGAASAPKPLFTNPSYSAAAPALLTAGGVPQPLTNNYTTASAATPASSSTSTAAPGGINWEEQFVQLREKARVKVNELNEKVAKLTATLEQQNKSMYDAQREKLEATRTAEDLRLARDQNTQQINHLRTQLTKIQNKNLFETTKKTNALFGEEEEEIAAAAKLGGEGTENGAPGAAPESGADLALELAPWKKKVDALLEEKRKAEDERDRLELERKQLLTGVETLKNQAKTKIQELQQQLSSGGVASLGSTGPSPREELETKLKEEHAKELEELKQQARAKMEEMKTAYEKNLKTQTEIEVAKARKELEDRFAAGAGAAVEASPSSKKSCAGEISGDAKAEQGSAAEASNAEKSPSKTASKKDGEDDEAAPKVAADDPAAAEKQAALAAVIAELKEKIRAMEAAAVEAQNVLKQQAVAKMSEMKTAYETALTTERAKCAELQQTNDAQLAQIGELQAKLRQTEEQLSEARASLQQAQGEKTTFMEQVERTARVERQRLEKELEENGKKLAETEKKLQERVDAADVAAHNFSVEMEEKQRQMGVLREQKDAELENVKQMAREKIAELQTQMQMGAGGGAGNGAAAGDAEAVRAEYESVLADYKEQARAKFAELTAEKEALEAAREEATKTATAAAAKYAAELDALQRQVAAKDFALQQRAAELPPEDASSASAEFEVIQKDEVFPGGTTKGDDSKPAKHPSNLTHDEIDKLFEDMDDVM